MSKYLNSQDIAVQEPTIIVPPGTCVAMIESLGIETFRARRHAKQEREIQLKIERQEHRARYEAAVDKLHLRARDDFDTMVAPLLDRYLQEEAVKERKQHIRRQPWFTRLAVLLGFITIAPFKAREVKDLGEAYLQPFHRRAQEELRSNFNVVPLGRYELIDPSVRARQGPQGAVMVSKYAARYLDKAYNLERDYQGNVATINFLLGVEAGHSVAVWDELERVYEMVTHPQLKAQWSPTSRVALPARLLDVVDPNTLWRHLLEPDLFEIDLKKAFDGRST